MRALSIRERVAGIDTHLPSGPTTQDVDLVIMAFELYLRATICQFLAKEEEKDTLAEIERIILLARQQFKTGESAEGALRLWRESFLISWGKILARLRNLEVVTRTKLKELLYTPSEEQKISEQQRVLTELMQMGIKKPNPTSPKKTCWIQVVTVPGYILNERLVQAFVNESVVFYPIDNGSFGVVCSCSEQEPKRWEEVTEDFQFIFVWKAVILENGVFQENVSARVAA